MKIGMVHENHICPPHLALIACITSHFTTIFFLLRRSRRRCVLALGFYLTELLHN